MNQKIKMENCRQKFSKEICENIEQLAIEENRTFNNMVETLLMKALECKTVDS